MFGIIGEVISARSFSSLWYWIAVAVFWAQMTRQVMGVPHDVVARARDGGAALEVLELTAQMQAQRILFYWQRSQVLAVVLITAQLALITALAFYYGIELAQAIWFLAVPLVMIWGFALRGAQLVMGEKGRGAALLKLMYRLRFATQIIGFGFIFANAIWAMYRLVLQGFAG